MNPTTEPAAGPREPQPGGVVRLVDAVIRGLPAITLCAVLTITASAEFELARTVLALPPHIAWALPVAIDSYVLAALRSGRDVLPAMGVMAGALTASMAAHLASTDLANEAGAAAELPRYIVAPAATAIMVVLVVVAWRVHVLIGHPHTPTAPAVPDAATANTSVPDAPAATRATVETGAPVGMPDSAGALTGAPVPGPAVPASAPGTAGTLAGTPAGTAGTSVPPDGVPDLASTVSTTSRPGTVPDRRPPFPAVALARAPHRVTAHTPADEASGPDETPRGDAQLVAAILARHGASTGELPSIRALKRRYGVGTARAIRLHAQATAARQAGAQRHPAPRGVANSPRENPGDDEQSQNHEDDQSGMQESAKKNLVSSEETKESSDQSESDSGEASGIEEQKPHTCITDRVGPAPAPGESAAALSDPEYRAISGAAELARKDASKNASERGAVRAESTTEAGDAPC